MLAEVVINIYAIGFLLNLALICCLFYVNSEDELEEITRDEVGPSGRVYNGKQLAFYASILLALCWPVLWFFIALRLLNR